LAKGLILWGVKSIYYVSNLDEKDKKTYECRIKGKIIDIKTQIKNRKDISPLVTGDIVDFNIVDENSGVIVSRHERKNEILRLKNNGREIQTLAANTDRLIIVDSVVSPPVRPFFIDRCIFSAETMSIPVTIVLNKSDLIEKGSDEYTLTKRIIDAYSKIGIETIITSVSNGNGIDRLYNVLQNKISNMIGRSGVGKSSIIKKLSNDRIDPRIGAVSSKFNRGTHTTNFSQIYSFDNIRIIDTPGIREFSIYIDQPSLVEQYFRDFDGYRDNCKYPNCQHISEPGCKVLEALNDGLIYDFRYESYIRIRDTIDKLKDSKI